MFVILEMHMHFRALFLASVAVLVQRLLVQSEKGAE